MATQAEPVTDALFQALSSPEPDPRVVHAAIEEVRQIASQNVIAALGAKIDSQNTELGAKIDSQNTELGARIDSQNAELGARIDSQNAELGAKIDSQNAELGAKIDALGSRIDMLQKVLWPLIVLIAVPVLSLAYRILTAPV